MADLPTFGFDDELPGMPEKQAEPLRVELVPSTSWGANLRSALPTAVWDRLRKHCYRLANYRCEICGGKGPTHPVECHEVWQYDDHKHVQTLERLIALCPACHKVKHFGRTLHTEGAESAFLHLMSVNDWTLEQAQEHVTLAFMKWQLRSEHQWVLDLTWLESNGVIFDPQGSA